MKDIYSLKNKNCFYLKPDKENSIIVLNKQHYFKRIEQLIEIGIYKELKKNRLNKMIRKPTSIINNSKIVGKKNSRFLVIVQNPQFPKIYGLP